MLEWDPGPPAAFAAHFADHPSYTPWNKRFRREVKQTVSEGSPRQIPQFPGTRKQGSHSLGRRPVVYLIVPSGRLESGHVARRGPRRLLPRAPPVR
jgi:hypothetical protein